MKLPSLLKKGLIWDENGSNFLSRINEKGRISGL